MARRRLDFVIWGGLHGLFLVINHLFREIFPLARTEGKRIPMAVRATLGWFFTMLAVVVTMVIFRAASIHDAIVILQAMVGIAASSQQPLTDIVSSADDGWTLVLWVSLFALFAPNTQEIMNKFQPTSNTIDSHTRWQWRPSPILAVIGGLALAVSVEYWSSQRISLLPVLTMKTYNTIFSCARFIHRLHECCHHVVVTAHQRRPDKNQRLSRALVSLRNKPRQNIHR